jgi:hypothetical protein
MDTRICRMKRSLGTTEHCPGAQCPFWEQDGCGFEELDFQGRPELAGFLLDLRSNLESVRDAEDRFRGPQPLLRAPERRASRLRNR